MTSPRRLDVHAPIFIPGQIWMVDSRLDRSFPRPLTTHGIMISNPVDNPYDDAGTYTDSQRILRSVPDRAEQGPYAAGADLALLNLQQLIRRRSRSAFTKVDNTARAMEAEHTFNQVFGSDIANLRAWQNMCFFCGRFPWSMPTTIFECQKWLSQVYVNVFDFVEAATECRITEPRYNNAYDLEQYSKRSGNIFPAVAARNNQLLRFLLKKWY